MTRAADMANPPKPQQQSHGDNESLGIASTEIFRSNSELKRKLMRLVNLIPDEDDCETKVFDEISCILATLKSQKLRFQKDKSVTNSVKITQSDKSVTSSVTIKQSDKSVSSSVPIMPQWKKYIAKLMDALSADHQSQRREAAQKLRVVTNKWRPSRAHIGGADIIPTLITLLRPDLETQEHVVTTLLNLSIYKPNRSLIAEKGGIPPIVEVLRSGNMAAKENAAAALFRLSTVDKAQIGACDAIPPLVELLRDGNRQGKDAAFALHNLCVNHRDNKSRSVRAGLVPVLLDFIRPEEAKEDLYLLILTNLSKSEEGRKAIGDANALPLLMECIKAEGCSRNKENAVKILSALCSNDTRYLEEVKNNDGGAGFKQALTDLRLTGSSTAERAASVLLAQIARYQRQITM